MGPSLRRGVALLAVAACGASVVCRGDTPEASAPVTDRALARRVDRDVLMKIVRRLSSPEFEGRATGTPGGLRARRFIERQFRRIGLPPARDSGFLQFFQLKPRPGLSAQRKEHGAEGANVAGSLTGTEANAPVIVVSAHYDHIGIVNGALHAGADDNASGVAVLLAAAAHFAAHSPRHPMIFVAFDGEEIGLAGSTAFMADPPVPASRMALNVNLDMVSRSEGRKIFAAGASHTPRLRPVLEDVRRRTPVRLVLGHDGGTENGDDDWTDDSDHWPFHRAGVPFVYLGVEDHPDYHRPTDTADRIDARFLGDVADMILEALIAFDRALD
jgi:Zn-dependent M28 family amino/carboxypeptidase